MNDLVTSTNTNSYRSAEDEAAELAYQTMVGEAIQALRNILRDSIKITLTNEFGAAVHY